MEQANAEVIVTDSKNKVENPDGNDEDNAKNESDVNNETVQVVTEEAGSPENADDLNTTGIIPFVQFDH